MNWYLQKCVRHTRAGIGAVLCLLYEADGALTAGKISDLLQISTARVAVLIKKMDAKGLVTKERGIVDARRTIVRLTACGEQLVQEMQDVLYRQIGLAIDAVGEERLLDFIETAKELRCVMEPHDFRF